MDLFRSVVILLPWLVYLFWCAVYVMDWRTSPEARHVLTLFYGAASLLYFCHIAYFEGYTAIFPVTDPLYMFCNLSVFPLYYIYIIVLSDPDAPPPGRLALYLLPALAVTAWDLVVDNAGASQAHRNAVVITARVLFVIEVVFVAIRGFKRLYAFRKLIDDYYSNQEFRSTQPTRMSIILLIIGTAVSVTASILGRESFTTDTSLLAIPSLTFSVILFIIGYIGLKQTFTIAELKRETTAADSIQEAEPIDDDEARQDAEEASLSALYDRLEELLVGERLYLDNDLRLTDIARRLGVGRTRISAAINRRGGVTFSDFVNSLRVRHACDLLDGETKAETLSLLEISELSGFTSESSFYRIFRKFSGMTPMQWKTREKAGEKDAPTQ